MPSERPQPLKYIFAYPQKFLADLLIWAVVTPAAFLLRFDFAIPSDYVSAAAWFTAFSLLVKVILIPAFGLNLQSWRHVSLADVIRLGSAMASMLVLQYLYIFLVRPGLSVPRSVPLIEFTLSVLAMVGMRTLSRIRYRRSLLKNPVEHRRELVIGAGEAGAMVVREMRAIRSWACTRSGSSMMVWRSSGSASRTYLFWVQSLSCRCFWNVSRSTRCCWRSLLATATSSARYASTRPRLG